jgi:hypothetical protein
MSPPLSIEPKPVPCQISNLLALPNGLAPLMDQDRWIAWNYRRHPEKQGWDKPPVGPWKHRQYWLSHPQAVARKQAGIGFVLSPDCDIAAIDLDDIRRGDDEAEWAKPILALALKLNIYTEITVSGNGARIIGRTARADSLMYVLKGLDGPKSGFEIYLRPTGRYITVSGNAGEGDANVNIDPIIDDILQHYPRQQKPSTVVASFPNWRVRKKEPPDAIDAEVMARITGPLSVHDAADRSAAFHGVVRDLFYGNYSVNEICELMEPHPNGVAQKAIESNRLPGEVARSFDKHRAELEASLANTTDIFNRRASGHQPRTPGDEPPAAAEEASVAAGTENAPVALPERGSWRSKAMRTGRQMTPNVANARLAISSDFPGLLAFNEMSHETMLYIDGWQRLSDNHVIEMQTYLQRMGLQRITKETVHDAIQAEARRHSFHPIRRYLESLTWDGVERLSKWLSTYLGTVQSEYTAAVGTMFLISAVARVMRPGCQADYTLVLEGGQGQLKSSACRTLAGDAYFLDHLPALKNKDSSQILRGKWIIECAEMLAFSEAKIRDTKEFLTRRTEIYFARYGRVESKEPRQCVIIISTNDSLYLHDTTGNRRYWPVPIGTIDLAALKRDRDQLWAEAKARFDAGEMWWPDADFEREHIRPEQEAREAPEDPWTHAVAEFLGRPDWNTNPVRYRERVTIAQVMEGGLLLGLGRRVERKDSDRVAKILLGLGWVRGTKVKGQQTFQRPPPPAPTEWGGVRRVG